MKIGIRFSDTIPVMSIGSLEGIIMNLWGRAEYIVNNDPMNDTLSTWFRFFIVQEENEWKFDYRSNCQYSDEEGQQIFDNLLGKANQAIVHKKETDLSHEFNALNIREPYSFGGLFSQMNEHYYPGFESKDQNGIFSEMREKLRSSLTLDEIESDEHLKSFVFQTPLETIFVDTSRGKSQPTAPW
jgi:hypothetical protein